jgi:phospholipid/cholesterol/gamma-HCH transport system ATP-binding protein
VAEIDRSGNPYVDQFIHGRAEGPIRMQVKRL